MFNELTLKNDLRALKQQYITLDKQYKNLLIKYNNIEKEILDIKKYVVHGNMTNKRLARTVTYANRDQ